MGILRFGHTLITIAGLSYLGVGAQPPTPDWGAMLHEAQPYMRRAPFLALIPGATIFHYRLERHAAGTTANWALIASRTRLLRRVRLNDDAEIPADGTIRASDALKSM